VFLPFKGEVGGLIKNDLVGLKGFRNHVKVVLVFEDVRVGEVEGLFNDGLGFRELTILITEVRKATAVFSKLKVFIKKMEFGFIFGVN